MSLLRSEIAAEAWRQRYVRGVCELDEMEAGVGRALAGECSDAEWLDLSHEHRIGLFAQPVTRPGQIIYYYE